MSTETEGCKLRPYKRWRRKTQKKTNCSIPTLPLSLIESEILPRLPSKTVGACRCVCKQWKLFLSTPTFARMHLPYHATINDYKLLLIDGANLLMRLPLSTTIPSNPHPSDVVVLATLDGLVCLASRHVHSRLVFWNPLTGDYRKLSSIDPDDPFFDYCTSSDVIGFYKDSCGDYKLLYLKSHGDSGAYVYSHRLDRWREVDFSLTFKSNDGNAFCSWSPGTFWGQRVYFTVTGYYISPHARLSWIICFDVMTETFRKIRFPHVPSRNFCGGLVVLNGSLHLCVSYEIDDWKHGDLWRMDGDGDGDGWVKVGAFRDPLYNGHFTRQHICTATVGNWIAVLDQENNSFTKVNTEDFTRYYRYFCSTRCEYSDSRMIYVETLVSPNP